MVPYRVLNGSVPDVVARVGCPPLLLPDRPALRGTSSPVRISMSVSKTGVRTDLWSSRGYCESSPIFFGPPPASDEVGDASSTGTKAAGSPGRVVRVTGARRPVLDLLQHEIGNDRTVGFGCRTYPIEGTFVPADLVHTLHHDIGVLEFRCDLWPAGGFTTVDPSVRSSGHWTGLPQHDRGSHHDRYRNRRLGVDRTGDRVGAQGLTWLIQMSPYLSGMPTSSPASTPLAILARASFWGDPVLPCLAEHRLNANCPTSPVRRR